MKPFLVGRGTLKRAPKVFGNHEVLGKQFFESMLNDAKLAHRTNKMMFRNKGCSEKGIYTVF